AVRPLAQARPARALPGADPGVLARAWLLGDGRVRLPGEGEARSARPLLLRRLLLRDGLEPESGQGQGDLVAPGAVHDPVAQLVRGGRARRALRRLAARRDLPDRRLAFGRLSSRAAGARSGPASRAPRRRARTATRSARAAHRRAVR